MTGTVNQRCEPTARDFKLIVHTPHGRTHKPHTLFNAKRNGLWCAEIGDGLRATVTRDAEGKWALTLSRGLELGTFFPFTVTREPWELCFWLPAGFFGPVCEVHVTAG